MTKTVVSDGLRRTLWMLYSMQGQQTLRRCDAPIPNQLNVVHRAKAARLFPVTRAQILIHSLWSGFGLTF